MYVFSEFKFIKFSILIISLLGNFLCWLCIQREYILFTSTYANINETVLLGKTTTNILINFRALFTFALKTPLPFYHSCK